MNKLELPFDLYTRNFLISKLMGSVRENKRKLKILDVGGRNGQLKKFLDKKDSLYILDTIESDNNEKNYFVGNIINAPLKDDSFDVVISSDLYEHIPEKDRLKAVSEMTRLSKNFVILGAPFYSKDIETAEKEANNFFLKNTGEPHPWLKEHIQNGLPSKEELERFLAEKGYQFSSLGTNNLSNWLLLQFFIFYAYKYSIAPRKISMVYRYYNENFVELGDFSQPTYRKIYLIGKKGRLPSLKYKLKTNKGVDLLKRQKLLSLVFDCIGENNLEKENHIRNLDGTITSLNDQLQLKERDIVEINSIVQEKENHIRNLDGTITSLNDQLQLKERDIAKINSVAQEKLEDKNRHIQGLEGELGDIRNENLRINTELNSMESSVTWKAVMKWHSFIEKIAPIETGRRRLYDRGIIGLRTVVNEGWLGFWWKVRAYTGEDKRELNDYELWIQKNEPKKEELEKIKKECKNFRYKPKISIITPVWNTDEKWLRLAIESVLNQVYDDWELCLADGGSTKPHVKKVLDEYAKKDSRFKVKFLEENKGIAGNSNEALSLATGEFIGLLDHDDELTPFALYEVVKLLNQKSELDFIYSDEDKITTKGKRRDPFFKSDWSPDMFLSHNYLCHLSVIRKALVDKVSGFREGYDGSQDYDLFLRVTELIDNEKRIAHIPKILYHWRLVLGSAAEIVSAKPYALVVAKKALKDALTRRGIEGEVLDGLFLSSYRVRYKITGNPKVSIIIPTKDKIEVLKTCIESIQEKTSYDNYEIVVVDNQSKEEKTFKYYDKIKNNLNIKILEYNKPFNFSAINNFAVSKVDTDYILLLNNDTEVISGVWLFAMLEHAQREEVGAVGAKLLYPSNTIQHAGIVVGIIGKPPVGGHSHRHFPASNPGYFGRIQHIQNLSAVTAACMMLRKEVFEEVGGFDENLSVAFNDVDLCLKIREKGYLIVYTPYAKLYHHESLSRGYEDTPEKQKRFSKEVEYVREKWRNVIDKGDQYYNPNLTLDKEDFSIKL